MKIIPITILKIIIFLFLLSSSSIAFTQDKESKSSPPKTGDGIATTALGTLLDGDWTVKEFRVTGVYSGSAKQEALEALGKTVRFNSGDALLYSDVLLYDGQHCFIESAKQIEIDDTGPTLAITQDKESKSSPPKTGDGIATTAPGTLLDGDWIVREFRVTGAYPGSAEQEALEALGKTVRFNSGDALLYDGQHCVIESAKQIEIDDTFRTFGSSGGSYKEIGLKPIPGKDNHYQVEEINLTCEKGEETRTRRVWIANDGDLILLSVHGVWVQLEKLTFGSWGGSYKEIGLKPIPGKDNHYQVEEINLTCEKGEEPHRVWIANNGDLILLSVRETWVQLEKLTFSP